MRNSRGFWGNLQRRYSRVAAPSGWLALLVLVFACESPEDSRECIPVGVLLPFTGDLSSGSANIERALLLGIEQLNQTEPMVDQRFCLQAGDTNSDRRQGLDAAEDLVLHHSVQALLGPQDDDLALRVVNLIRDRRVVGMSGGTTSPALRFADDDGLWFRTVPSAIELGRALAQRMRDDGVQTMAVLYEGSEFGAGWASVLQINFTALGGSSAGIFSYPPGQRSFTEQLSLAFAPGVDAVALVASAHSGAVIVEEWATSGRGGRFYFAPSLNDPVFVDNIPPGSVAGMVGISPDIADGVAGFADRFTERWDGEPPVRAAYFYYDALMSWALAYLAAAGGNASTPGALQVAAQLARVCNPPGTTVDHRDLDQALARLDAGEDVDYQGVSGSIDFDAHGEVLGARPRFWRIEQSTVVDAD